ncbi:cytochrome d ubiquinol oxidase subunit II [Hoyosella rhizosphaerae]|uniref:Cytochrome D ubiquinol oxydase CydB n=1 Tax=Hoyosella rhizosphaerae TaxID=1755582 RepID=A0A916UJV0_9ACTN|nr:cytochrome d ubiquinol oxidase subunit II [Hoyosella rhizosphaerae]MBN4928249.1 cytochrome d ubiquinol oxidase subunit II [Hoyosella rhizosphaerae]GGC73544.1 putative cytochrome D ubiquinol oxydase CydB [Hoyosella rhizosphaerae]
MELTTLWFILIAFLFLGYFVLEGFDFGVGMLMPFLGRKSRMNADKRRRTTLNTIGPFWDGNEVWLITAGGALFAAFPDWYATLFSGFYLPLLLILIALIFRAVAIEFRGKIDDVQWRARCDIGIVVGSWIPAILWGMIFAAVVSGTQIDENKQIVSVWADFFSPYAVLGGITTALLFALHGAVFIALKTGGEVRADAVTTATRLAPIALVVAGTFAMWTQLAYGSNLTWIFTAIAAVGLAVTVVMTAKQREGKAFIATFITVAAATALLFGSLFPDVMPSSLNPEWSLTVEGAASSPYTLTVLTWAAAFLAPVVMIYQGWTYWVFRQRITVDHIPDSIGLKTTRRK